jgi:acyl dehydratase
VTEERLTRGIEAVEVGQSVSFSKTVAESDVYLFAGVSGDLHPMHVDEEYGKTTRYGRRIAHGALLVAYMSATSTRYLQTWVEGRAAQPCISYGYDRIRFIRPTFIGDTIRVDYRISEIDPSDEKAFAQVTCTNQRGEIVAAATHILKFV